MSDKNDRPRPEIILGRLNKRLLELRGAINYLNDENLYSKITEIIRKLNVASLLNEHYLVAIAGYQGAGKSTLLTQLYELDINILKPEDGLGEKSPLLILEKNNILEPEFYLRSLVQHHDDESTFYTEDRPVSLLEFQDALKNLIMGQIIPILHVPKRYFNSELQGFLLLPGYEKIDNNNRAWQELMIQTLIGSSAMVVVTDSTRLPDQRKILMDMERKFLSGAKPLIVVSKTEEWASDSSLYRETRTTACEVFNVPENEAEQRVILTGTTAQYRKKWIHKFEASLNKISLMNASVRERQLENLGNILRDDLSEVLQLIEEAKQIKEIEIHINNDAKSFLDAFDKSRDSLKREYSRGLNSALNSHTGAVTKNAIKYHIENHEGFKNFFLTNVTSFFKYTSGEREINSEERILGAWNGENNKGFTLAHLELLGKITSVKLKTNSESKNSILTLSPEEILGYKDKSGNTIESLVLNSSTEHNLKAIFLDHSDKITTEHLKLNKESLKTIELIPVLGLEFVRLAALFPEIVGVDVNLMIRREDGLRGASERIAADYNFLNITKNKIINNIATVLMIDAAAEGLIDSIPLLVTSLQGTQGATATAGVVATEASSAASVVAGGVAIGLISIAIIREVQRQDAADRDLIRGVLRAIRDANREHYISSLDAVMDQLRLTLENRLRDRYKLNEHFMRRDRITCVLSHVRSLKEDMLEAIGEESPSLV